MRTDASSSLPQGFRLVAAALDRQQQQELLDTVMAAAEAAPFYHPSTRAGRPFSVQTTNLGALGWVSDRGGYRYQPTHPVTGAPWPAMPPVLLDLWRRYASSAASPDACLVNLYRPGARMGLHQDRDEADLTVPVLSVSLGDTAVFRLGGATRNAPTRSVRLSSGDLVVLAGEARGAFHGVDRTIAASSTLIRGGGRVNLTLRRAGPL